MSCMVMIVHIPRERTMSMIIPIVRCWLEMSRLFVGSSKIRTDGSCTIALAIWAFWNSPPLISSMYFREMCDIPRASIISDTRSKSFLVALHSMYGLLPTSMVSNTDILDAGTLWGTYAIFLANSRPDKAKMSVPSTVIYPELGLRAPVMHLRKVVLPVPFGPSIDITVLGSDWKDIPFSTSFFPYENLMSFTSIIFFCASL